MHYLFVLVLAFVLLPLGPTDAATCKPLSLDFGNKDVGWTALPLSKLKRDTRYTLEEEDGRTVLRAAADRSASLYAAALKKVADLPPYLSWRWKANAPVPGADNRDKKREDAPVRLIVAFDGDKSTLPEAEQARFRRARKIFGRDLPYAVMMYIWSEQVPVGTVIPSAHTSQVKMLVVSSGAGGVGTWQSFRRNLAGDYRQLYGADPGRVLAVAVMTDTDNTGTKATGWYSDIRFDCGKE